MKKKIQFLLFMLSISIIIFIVILVGINIKKSNILPENINTETQDTILLRENTDTMVNSNIMASILLPPGSTSADLQEAVYNATSGDTIILFDDIIYTTTSPSIIIPEDKAITIQSDTSNNWTLSQGRSSIRHFTVNGTLTLQDLILEGGNKGGGVTVNSGATFNMNSNVTIQNCYNYDGGAVITYGIFNMYEATITKCSSGNGSVRCNAGGQFNIYGGTITDNSSSIGGGVNIAYLR